MYRQRRYYDKEKEVKEIKDISGAPFMLYGEEISAATLKELPAIPKSL